MSSMDMKRDEIRIRFTLTKDEGLTFDLLGFSSNKKFHELQEQVEKIGEEEFMKRYNNRPIILGEFTLKPDAPHNGQWILGDSYHY